MKETSTINPKKLTFNIFLAFMIASSIQTFIMLMMTVVISFSSGWDFAVSFIIEMVSSDGITQFFMITMFALFFLMTPIMAYDNSFDYVTKAKRVIAGKRYRELKAGWIR